MAADLHLDWTQLTVYRVLYHFFFFALGCFLNRRRELIGSAKLAGVSAMCLFTAGYFYVYWYVRYWYANWKLGIAVCICFLLLWLFYRFRTLAENRLLQLCGKHCLELYLLHTFFTAGFRSLLPLVGVRTPWFSVWLNFTLSTALCLLLAYLAGRFRWTDVIFRPSRIWERMRG